MPEDRPLHPDTIAITAGRSDNGTALSPAVWATTTWESTGLDDARRRATGMRASHFYARYANPTVRAFEEAVAALEGAESALAFGSGMGAVATTVLALCSSGQHIVAQKQLYSGTVAFLQGPCRRLGIDVTFVDGRESGALAAAVQPGRTMLVLAESPSNPLLTITDLDELGAIAGPFTVLDSTFATPIGQRPLAHGVDLVLHSATKGIGGNNDATLGVIAGERDLVDAVWGYSTLHGAVASPYDAANAIRGIRTLGVRVRHQADSASEIAAALASHPDVVAVHHPSLASHPQHALAKKQMDHFGSVLSIDLRGGHRAASAFLSAVRIARVATSLGGTETLVCHPATTVAASLTDEEQEDLGVTPGLLRVSVGLEHPGDLLADLTAAIESAHADPGA